MPQTSASRRIVALRLILLATACVLCRAATASLGEASSLEWSTDSVGPTRSISVHGRRASIFGYSQDGLEVWAYPFQILSSYKVTFRQQGTTSPIAATAVLRRIIYDPAVITRVYVGPDFVVREHIFVPLDQPGVIVRYEVASSRPLEIEVHFTPVLDLMWPGSIGGQEILWHSADSAYVLSEPTHRFSGSIGSPDIVAHDETPNSNRRLARDPDFSFTIRAGGDHPLARVFITGGPRETALDLARKLQEQEVSLEKLAADHYTALTNDVLQIETPDETVNRALAWSEIALDQAWVCNPDLGCGLVAGYGPSRKARRPQYDWFFAGDGMVALHALLADGQYARARQELEFILKYQDRKTGMIWHELSQSAGWIDWNKYPYMFVHVELTFDFLSSVADYVTATGDRAFIAQNWPSIQSAYNYCTALIGSNDGLPHIPRDKEGSREQERLGEELALSADWVRAAQAFADLARTAGYSADARDAVTASARARAAIPRRYWDDKQNFWISGFTPVGTPLTDHQIGPVGALNMFTGAQQDSILQQLASSDFQADWGTRGRASSSATYDPNSYANGSVWATGTAGVASAFWSAHRSATAFQIWKALLPWLSLDSLGHMHETLAGDFYYEQIESVPEQTWSSATFLSAAVHGLLGVRVDAATNNISFSPHVPADWHTVTLRHVKIGLSDLQFQFSLLPNQVRLNVQNSGAAVQLTFDPEIPLGAKLGPARFQGRRISAALESHLQDTHAKVNVQLPHGDSLLKIEYSGGVALVTDVPLPSIGDSSHGIKITSVTLRSHVYTIAYDSVPAEGGEFELYTPLAIDRTEGVRCKNLLSNHYRCSVTPLDKGSNSSYRHGEATVVFANIRSR